MSSGFMRVECRKFNPNIFNKTKCSNCFRQKEEHSAEALESNRAARKISKCGYLFVAPGWDFSNPINKTKRWQRRWFVLYDDGELSYSVDEHPETVPQASIDMNKVVEVADAEEVTGHAYSLAITAPDTVHFVKGTCRDEAKWWKDVLAIFPRSKGRHKRNATFPGSQTSALLQQTPLSCRNSGESARPRFNSCHTDGSVLVRRPDQWLCVDEENIYPAKKAEEKTIESPPRSIDYSRSTNSPELGSYKSNNAYRESPPTTATTSPSKTVLNYRESSPPVSIISLSSSLGTLPGSNLTSQPASSSSPPTRDKLHSEEKARARREKRGRSLTEQMRREKLKDIADSLTRPRTRPRTAQPSQHPPPTRDKDVDKDEIDTGKGNTCDAGDANSEPPVRGDPDGCGLDPTTNRYSPSAELRVALPAEDLLNLKKGWLMKQNGTEWSKHWFVLRGAALMYYRDPTAEDKGILDGVMDLSSVRAVSELQVQRNYGFQTVCWDDRRFVLSAVTAGIRNNWVAAIRRAAGLDEPKRDTYFEKSSSLTTAPTIGLQKSSSDCGPQSYLTGEHGAPGWSHPSGPLPPSPPLTRTPISRVKERAKTQVSRSRVYNKRSRSSPPSSRRNTLDTIRVPPVPEIEAYPRRQSFSKVLDEPIKSGDWTDSSLDKNWSLKLSETNLMRGRSVDSLSDLTNIDLDLDLTTLDKARVVEEYEELKGRFEKAVMEIRAMKRELRQSHAACDELELSGIRLRQDAKCREEGDRAEAALMAARIQDLASKLSAAEKQIRTLKQKASKSESREKRRSLSLKGRESFQIGREVEEKLSELEKKLSELEAGQNKPSKPVAKPRLRRKSLDSSTTEPISVLLRLSSLEGSLSRMDVAKGTNVRHTASKIVAELETLLREKLMDLTKRRNQLVADGRLDTQARLKLVAERLAVESVLVRKIWDAARCFDEKKSVIHASEVQEIGALIEAVRSRIRGEEKPIENPMDCLVQVLADRLVHVGDASVEPKRFEIGRCLAEDLDLEVVTERFRCLKDDVETYRAAVMPQVAKGLAMETICLTTEYEEGRCRDKEDQRLRDAWTAAQETLNRELVQAELSHVAMRWSTSTEGGARMSWFGLADSLRESWAADVAESLRITMDAVVEELTSEYENCLALIKRPVRVNENLETDAAVCRSLLEQFVAVLAGTTLIDTRIRLLTREEIKSDKKPIVRAMSLKTDVIDADIETECLYLFHRICATTSVSADVISVGDACRTIGSCLEVAAKLAECVGAERETSGKINPTWADLADRCLWLEDTLRIILKRVPDLETCARCPVLQASLEDLQLRRDEEMARLKQRHDWQLKELRGELENQRDSLVCQHELEQAQLLEKARRLERRLGTLDSEYAQQMENLRAAYQRTLSSELARDEDVEDSIRLRYQAEIQQLRALCEKGLIAVDNSHRRIIAQMEEKHRQEIAASAAEKDQALAEETQATLAALDAMRKAHETEVQREVGKFKTEWLRRMQSSHDFTALHRAHEEEMEEIKAEILSLSERYSDKCVESARLEEELGLVNKQLAQTQQTCLQLDARNRQLRAHLLADAQDGPLRIQDDVVHGERVVGNLNGDVLSAKPTLFPASSETEYQVPVASYEYGRTERVNEALTVLPRAELLRCRPKEMSPSLLRLSGTVAERMKLFESRS